MSDNEDNEPVFHYLKIRNFNHNVLVGRDIYKRRKTETDIVHFGRFVNTKYLKDGSSSIVVQSFNRLTGGMKNFDFFIKIPFVSDSNAVAPKGALSLDDIDDFANNPGAVVNIQNKLSNIEIKNLEVFELSSGLVHTTTGLSFDPFCWWVILS